jgi:hypothetical protein
MQLTDEIISLIKKQLPEDHDIEEIENAFRALRQERVNFERLRDRLRRKKDL